jgi:hypothetical protein
MKPIHTDRRQLTGGGQEPKNGGDEREYRGGEV